ncbi:MAG: ABC transporter ATP-binding protein [Phycisphaerae bacterium]|nr:ABC transporter ATP-binding protein [Phycisphaerae bacterium]
MIHIDQATKRFPGKNGSPVTALRDISLDVGPGELVMIVGPSGSGKSTLLFTIGGMQHPTEGRVLFDDTDVYGLSPSRRAAWRRTRIGFVFQTFNLVPYLSCLENVIVPAVLAGKSRGVSLRRASTLLERLGLSERLKHRPSELSVGERQRVALCRSLINDPDVILADEPTGNLDESMTGDVMNVLRDLNAGGQTIMMATHNPRLAEQGTRLVTLQEANLVRDEPCMCVAEATL